MDCNVLLKFIFWVAGQPTTRKSPLTRYNTINVWTPHWTCKLLTVSSYEAVKEVIFWHTICGIQQEVKLQDIMSYPAGILETLDLGLMF